MPLKLEIVTPERKVFSDEVDHVVLPTESGGEIDVLPGHIPLVTMINPGELVFYKNNQGKSIAIDKGFIEVFADTVSVLTEAAIEVTQIDTAQIDAAREKAKKALEEAKASGEDPAIIEELETKARFAVVQKLVAERKR